MASALQRAAVLREPKALMQFLRDRIRSGRRITFAAPRASRSPSWRRNDASRRPSRKITDGRLGEAERPVYARHRHGAIRVHRRVALDSAAVGLGITHRAEAEFKNKIAASAREAIGATIYIR